MKPGMVSPKAESVMEFDYESQSVVGNVYSITDLIEWIAQLHSELADNGHLPGAVSDETHQQLVILAKLAD
jgi:hypothetical protein